MDAEDRFFILASIAMVLIGIAWGLAMLAILATRGA